MYDIDPPSPVLRLSAPRPAKQPTLETDGQHLARIAQSDPWATRHSVASGPEAMVFRTSGAVLRLKALAEADADLSGALDAAL